MSQQFRTLRHQGSRSSSEFSLDERRRHFPLPDDPCIIEQAQDLLSQFVRASSQGPRQTEDPPETVTHGHTAFYRRQLNTANSDTNPPDTHQDSPKPKTAESSSSDDDSVIPIRAKSASSFARGIRPSRQSSSPVIDPQVLGSQSEGNKRRSGRPRIEPTNYYQILKQHQPDENSSNHRATQSTRSIKSVRGVPNNRSRSVQPQTRHGKNSPSSITYLDRLLRQRELGCGVNQRLHSSLMPDLKLNKQWKGASNDVIALTWSPDGTRFAVGATAQCDEHNMEYNRGNNLIIGDMTVSSLKELPDHWVSRPSGRSTRSPGITDDRLFMSVTDVQWFRDLLFTASYDNTVKLWDATHHHETSCLKTLKHTSKVQVMDRSLYNQNMLATGAESIGLWDIESSTYSPLEVSKKDIVPTCLAWGKIAATKNILLAGMSDKDPEDHSLPQGGLLAMWYAGEASMAPAQPMPSTQNVFDIKWHPSLPVFATASSFGHKRGTLKDAKSVVRLYEPLVRKACTVEFECPALDINEITFCPLNPNYLTASCTNGITYVWDYRRPDDILHTLEHSEPLNQMDEFLTREQADVGVRLALWGDAMDEFYTGASDGALKRWNILLSPEDTLVHDVYRFGEEIMCGSFSADKSNLLIGDGAGGIHMLSSLSHTGDSEMRFDRAAGPCEDSESESEPGVKAANQLLSSGQLVRHPVYGVGQGPSYKGPFAAWARPEGTPQDQLAQTPLEPGWQARQLDGAPVKDRVGLGEDARRDVQGQIQLAHIRNKRRNEGKRKRKNRRSNYVNLVSDEEDEASKAFLPRPLKNKKRRQKKKMLGPIITNVTCGIIDLTASGPEGDGQLREEASGDDLEDDFWWPESGNIDPNIQEADVL